MKPGVYQLKNKLKYLLIPNKCHQTLAIILLIKTGSANEPYHLGGISHFIEHMIFQGTKTYPTQSEISEILDSLGIEINAFTSKEMTVYHIKIGGDSYKKGLEIMSDIIQNSLIREEDISNEKRVVLNELRQRRVNPVNQLNELFYKKFFQGTHLELPVVGRSGTIRKFDRTKLLAYLNYYYQPKNMILVMSGNLNDNKDLHNDIDKLFGNFNRKNYFSESSFFNLEQKRIINIDTLLDKFDQKNWNKIIKIKSLSKKSSSKRITNIVDDGSSKKTKINSSRKSSKGTKPYLLRKSYYLLFNPKGEQTFVKIAFPGFTFNHPDLPVLNTISTLLTSGMSSRLFKRLRTQEGLVYNISGSNHQYSKLGSFVFSYSTKNNHNVQERVLTIIREELDKLKSELIIDKKELEKVKNQIIGQLRLQADNSYLIGLDYGIQILFNKKQKDEIKTLDDQIKEYDQITAKQIHQIANQVFDYSKMIIFSLSSVRLKNHQLINKNE